MKSLQLIQLIMLVMKFNIKTIHSYQVYHRTISSISMSSTSFQDPNPKHRICVIGGGASGMFAATSAASSGDCDVVVLEATQKTMSKVRISGGGRCNVMHDRTKPLPQILSSYPRGNKELRGLYTKRFTPDDAYNWFTSRGVKLKTEADGRMFPITDNSQTIIDAISQAAIKAGVEVRMKQKVDGVNWNEGKYVVNVSSKSQNTNSEEVFDALILATGSFPLGHAIARGLGHDIVKPVPSLFTLDAKDLVKEGGILHGLAGVSIPLARLTLVVTDDMLAPTGDKSKEIDSDDDQQSSAPKKKKKRKKKAPTITQEGPLLITHHGVSGPAALRLSAFAAREFHAVAYKTQIKINLCPKYEDEQRVLKSGSSEAILTDCLWEITRLIPKRRVATGCPLFTKESQEGESSLPVIPKRLWYALVEHSGIPADTTWGDVSKAKIRSLANNLTAFSLPVTSKSTFKEEFVTAGGMNLKEINMSTMESKVSPGLFMCGEVLDVDGVTGGFNFMGCWSTGYIAGQNAASFDEDS